jgi:hypothetical protein
MPYRHAEMPDQEMTHGLVQHVEEEPSAELENVKYYKIQKIQKKATIIYIFTIKRFFVVIFLNN